MVKQKYPGRLITFSGLDGSGKTTLIRCLKKELVGQGMPVMVTKQPTDLMRKSEIFRTFMDTPDHERYEYRALSLMCAADRLQHGSRFIRPLLEEGYTVICDRYYYDCLANLWARGYPEDTWIFELARYVPEPDAAFFLDVDPNTAIRRVRSRQEEKERYIDVELQHRLHTAFQQIAEENQGIVLNTEQPEAACYAVVCQVVMDGMEREKEGRAHAAAGIHKLYREYSAYGDAQII